jgi:acylphosphatase
MKYIKIKIYGQVQGVSFRLSAKQKADELKIFGFVKNMNDGSVFIEAEGEEEKLYNFLKWCHQGPISAKVESVKYNFSSENKKFKDFKIKY